MATTVVDIVIKTLGTSKLDQANKKLKGTAAEAVKASEGLDKLAGKSGKTSNNIRGIGRSAKDASVGVKVFSTAVKGVLAPIAALTSAAALVSSAFSVLQRQDFAEAKFETLGGNSKELVANLKEVSKELNGSASVVELTAAAYDVASAGFSSAAEASQVLKAAAQGAVGGFSDINTVGNAATSVLNAYGLAASEAGRVVDQFIQTQNDGKIVVDEYAQNIGKVASAAAGLKIPLSEVNAVIAQSTAAGVQSEVAFTGLKGALARLASGEASKALKGVGIDISAATIEADGLLGTLQKLEGLDTGQIFQALGTEAGPALLPVIQNLERFEELINNQEGAVGTAAAAQARAANTINGALNRIRVAWENFITEGSAGSRLIIIALDAVAVSIQALGAFTQGLVTIYQRVQQAVVFAIQVIQNTWNAFYQYFITLVNNTLNAWNNFLNKITGNSETSSIDIQNSFGGIADFFDQLTLNIQKAWNGMLKQMIAGIVNFTTAFNNSPLQKMAEFAGVDLGAFVAPALVGEVTSQSSRPQAQSTQRTALEAGITPGMEVGSIPTTTTSGPSGRTQTEPQATKKSLEELFGGTKNLKATILERELQLEQQIGDALALGNTELAKELALKKALVPLNEEIFKLEEFINDLKTNPKVAENFSADEIGKALKEATEQLDIRKLELANKTQQDLNKLTAEGLKTAEAAAKAREDALRPLNDQRELLEAKLNGNEAEVRLMQEARDIARDIPNLTQQEVVGLLQKNQKLEESVRLMEAQKEAQEELASNIAGELTGALGDVIKQTKSVEEAFNEMLTNIGNMFIDMAMDLLQQQITSQLTSLFSSLLGGGALPVAGGGIPGFANGGRPPMGQVSIVGERGPEFLVPDQPSTVVTPLQAMAMYPPIRNTPSEVPIPINVTSTVINNVEYVTREEAQAIGQAAANEGGKLGERRAINALQNKRSTRSKLGM